MNTINRKTILMSIFKFVLPLFVILFIQVAVNAQSYTQEEQNCYNQVQNKVAWNKEGSNVWGEDNARNLCRGATDTYVRVKCFVSNMPQLGWQRATEKCAAPAVADPSAPAQPAFNLNGTWAMYEGNGKQYDKSATITQSGNSLTINNGYGSQETVNLAGFQLSVRAWRLSGIVSVDGKRIDWSNGFYWLNTSAATVLKPTIKFKNDSLIFANVNVFSGDQPFADRIGYSNGLEKGKTGNVYFPGGGVSVNTPLEIEVLMSLLNGNTVTIYRGTITPNSTNTYCFETAGDVYKPSIKPCENTQSVEAKRIELKNEAGFNAIMKMDYTQQKPDGSKSAKTITTDETILGFNRFIYLPRDAAPGSEMTLKINAIAASSSNLLSTSFYQDSFDSKCYKVWGGLANVTLGPCETSSTAQKIKFKNNAAIFARIVINYFDQKGKNQTIKGNELSVLREDTIEMPQRKPGTAWYISLTNTATGKGFYRQDYPGDVDGDLCFKAEGIHAAEVGSTCDDVVGVNSGETRQIRFQNDAGFDAQLIVTYFEDQVINGTSVAMPKTLVTGMITGLGGKFRLVNIPKNTSKGMPITISLQGSATLKNDIFSTTLQADFAASPQPCFKVTGTLFDPAGGKCNQ